MNRSFNHDPSLEPSGRMSTMRIGIGLFGAPAAWIAQVFLSEPLAAYACYPYRMPLSAPIWERLPVMLATIGIACFTVALLSGLVAWTSWRQFNAKPVGGNRNRFLVKLGAMSSFIFIVATLFNMCAILLVQPCSAWV